MGDYREAEKYYTRVLEIEEGNRVALMGLHLLYSNYMRNDGNAISIAQRLLKIENTPKFKSFLAADLICNGKFTEGRNIAKEASKTVPEGNIKHHLIVRFLILASYFLEGKRYNGNVEAHKLLDYYRDLEDVEVKIQEREWSPMGLTNTIENNKKIGTDTRELLTQLIGLLEGKEDSKRTLKSLAKKVSEEVDEESSRRNNRLKIVLPIIFIASGIAIGFTLDWAISQDRFCPEDMSPSRVSAGLEQYPSSMAFNPNNNRIYLVSQADTASEEEFGTNNIIVVCAINNREIVSESVNIPGIEEGDSTIAVNPDTNKIYVANSDSNTVTVISGGTSMSMARLFSQFIGNFNSVNMRTLEVGQAPVGIAVDADDDKAYVINQGSNSISVIHGNSITEPDIRLGQPPTSIAVDSETNRVYVTSDPNLGPLGPYDEETISHTFDEAGTYYVDLIITDSGGQIASDRIRISVKERLSGEAKVVSELGGVGVQERRGLPLPTIREPGVAPTNDTGATSTSSEPPLITEIITNATQAANAIQASCK